MREIKILIVNPGPVYPIKAMNQMRTHNMIRSLAKDFPVDLASPAHEKKERELARSSMSSINGNFFDLGSIKPKSNILIKRIFQIKEYLAYYFLGFDREYIGYRHYQKEILRLLKVQHYSIVISNYWEGSTFFTKVERGIMKILDPHYAVGENWDVFYKNPHHNLKGLLEYRRLKKNSHLEKRVVLASDLLLPLSKANLDELAKIDQRKALLLIPDGSDINHYSSFNVYPDARTILFYGSMSSIQNDQAFWRFFRYIYSKLKSEYKDLKLLVVGSGPSKEILSLNNGKDIIITGFVDDVRPWLSRAWFKVIPLEIGSGFRGRVIELMSMGIPVIGTHNALDNIELEHGLEGFVSDSDHDLICYSKALLEDPQLRKMISTNALNFVRQKYSIEATFNKLNYYIKQL